MAFPLADSPEKTGRKHRRAPWILAAVILLGGLTAFLLVGPASRSHTLAPNASSSNGPSEQDWASLSRQYSGVWSSYVSGANGAIAAWNASFSDANNQEANIQQDQATYNSNEFGNGCSAADLTNYSSCLQQEEQTATQAQNDITAANTQIESDFHSMSNASQSYASAVDDYIGQVIGIAWPASMDRVVTDIVAKARQLRVDEDQEASFSGTSDPATASAMQTQARTDQGDLVDLNSLMTAELNRLAGIST